MKIKYIIKLIRPEQWIKNVFVALPLFFSGSLPDTSKWCATAVAFIAFSLIASSIYCINDVADRNADRIHPKKKNRPVASGRVSVTEAIVTSCICFLCSVASCALLPWSVACNLCCVILAYFAINIAYCLRLKHFAIIDVFIIALGFVLRIVAGGIATHIWLSPWIVCMTFLIALFLAFAKRRDDVLIRETKKVVVRKNTEGYNLDFLNITLSVIGAVTLVCYVMYTISPEVVSRFGSSYVYVTSIFVLAGIIRYLQVVMVDGKSGSPTRVVMHDNFIRICILLWILSFGVIIYMK